MPCYASAAHTPLYVPESFSCEFWAGQSPRSVCAQLWIVLIVSLRNALPATALWLVCSIYATMFDRMSLWSSLAIVSETILRDCDCLISDKMLAKQKVAHGSIGETRL
jgi:hypothetical protein